MGASWNNGWPCGSHIKCAPTPRLKLQLKGEEGQRRAISGSITLRELISLLTKCLWWAGPGLIYPWRRHSRRCKRTFIYSPHVITRTKFPTITNLASPPSPSPFLPLDLPACRDDAFWTPLLLGGRRLYLLAASFRCPALPGKEWVVWVKNEISEDPLGCRPKATFSKKCFQ